MSSNSSNRDFIRIEKDVQENVDAQYFEDPSRFKSLHALLDIVGNKDSSMDSSPTSSNLNNDPGNVNKRMSMQEQLQDKNDGYHKLIKQQTFVNDAIEDVVRNQEGMLNNAVDTMGYVI